MGDRFGSDAREFLDDDSIMRDDSAKLNMAFGDGLYEGQATRTSRFVVQACDDNGEPLDTGGQTFNVMLSNDSLHYDFAHLSRSELPEEWDPSLDPNGYHRDHNIIIDNEDGTYLCEYTPSRDGEYELSISLDGFEIQGSPFH